MRSALRAASETAVARPTPLVAPTITTVEPSKFKCRALSNDETLTPPPMRTYPGNTVFSSTAESLRDTSART